MRRLFSLALALAAVGCHTPNARYVTRQSESGVVAISSNTPSERDKGLALIERHVGSQFVIEKEEVVMMADTTHRKRDRGIRVQNDPKISSDSQKMFAMETNPSSEHRIYYRRSTPMTSTPLPLPTETTSGVVAASASLPAMPTIPTVPSPTRETTPAPGGVKSFLPLTCEGCQGR